MAMESKQDELDPQIEALRDKVNRARATLSSFFVDKQPLIDLMTCAAVAQEPLLLVGPPGTAKSDLVIKFKDALGLASGDYFEYLLTRSPSRRRSSARSTSTSCAQGRYLRRERGKLPDRAPGVPRRDLQGELGDPELAAHRHQRAQVLPGRRSRVPVKLKILFAATNEHARARASSPR